jgi:hypothetical protein
MLNSLYRPVFIDNCTSEFWFNRLGPGLHTEVCDLSYRSLEIRLPNSAANCSEYPCSNDAAVKTLSIEHFVKEGRLHAMEEGRENGPRK